MNSTQCGHLVWFDTEYTTLDLEQASLIQVAMVVTDMQGHRIAPAEQDYVTPVRLPADSVVSEFVAKECPELVKQARAAETPTATEVDQQLVARLNGLLGPTPAKVKNRPILAGNTIHADWWFAQRYLPQFLACLHYRQLDVSALKILWLDAKLGPEFDKENIALVREFLPGWTLPDKAQRHNALYDVMASIAELNFYRRKMLKET